MSTNPSPAILCWDLETSHLKANMGHIICAAAKWVGQKSITTWRIDDIPGFGTTPHSYINDTPIVAELVDMINDADAIVAHYGGGFDLPFLTTRALVQGLRPPSQPTMIDPWRTARQHLALTSNRMATVASALSLKEQKGKVPLEMWPLAAHGHRPTLTTILNYCEQDVRTLEQEYLTLRPLMRTHPALFHGDGQCKVCGSWRVKVMRPRRTRTLIIDRVECQKCGCVSEGSKRRA